MHNEASCMYRHRPTHAARFSIYQSTFKPLCRAASACHPGSIGRCASLHADEIVPLLERLAIIEMFVPGTLATYLSA